MYLKRAIASDELITIFNEFERFYLATKAPGVSLFHRDDVEARECVIWIKDPVASRSTLAMFDWTQIEAPDKGGRGGLIGDQQDIIDFLSAYKGDAG